MTCWFVAVLISKCYRARCLRRASKILRPSPRLLPRNSSHLEAPEAPGAASWRLQRLWEQPLRGPKGFVSSYLEAPKALGAAPEALGAAISTLQRLREQPSRGCRGSGSSHREVPEALGAAISRIQRLSRPNWLRPQFSRVFSSILEPGDLLGSAPNSSGWLEEAFRRLRGCSRRLPGGFEWLQERSEVASGRVKWLRVASRALEEAPQITGNQWEPSQANSKVLSTASSID